MANDQAVKSKRVLISMLSKFDQYSRLPKDVFFKIFDTKICLFLYGAEIWAVENRYLLKESSTTPAKDTCVFS